MALPTHSSVSAARRTPEALLTVTGPTPVQYGDRPHRRFEVTLSGWQLGLSSSSVVAMAIAVVVAWAVHR